MPRLTPRSPELYALEAVPAPSTAAAPSRDYSGVARTAAAVSISHGLVDPYAGFLPPLLPRIMSNMGLSIAMAAVGLRAAALLSVPLLFVATALARHPPLAPHARRAVGGH